MKSKNRIEELNFCSLAGRRGSYIVGYKFQRSPRLKTLQIQVKSRDLVVLKMPNRCSRDRALTFMKEHSDWVIEALRKQPKVATLKDYLVRNPRIAASGKWYKLVFKFRSNYLGYHIRKSKREVEIYLASFEDHDERLCQILKEVAKELIIPRVEELSAKHRVKVHGITIRNQQMRWGSCNETAGLNLNWRLLLLRPALQDHIILHELCHLRHFDHSDKFHNLLAKWDSKAQEHSDEIDEISHQYISMGRPLQ